MKYKIFIIFFICLTINAPNIIFSQPSNNNLEVELNKERINKRRNILSPEKTQEFINILNKNFSEISDNKEVINNYNRRFNGDEAEQTSLELYNAFMNERPDINIKIGGDTLLTLALKFRALDIAEKLLEEDGLNPNLSDAQGFSPLQLAIFNYTETSTHNSKNVIEKLLKKGGNPDYVLETKETFNYPLLHLTILKKEEMPVFEIVKLLLENAANPEVKDKKGRTALMFALSNGDDTEITKLLLEHKASYEALNNNGSSALNYGLAFNPLNFEYKDFANETYPLESLKLVLEQNPNLNTLDKNGNNSLMVAAENTFAPKEIFKVLLNSNINLEQKNKNKENIIDLALKNKNRNALNVFLENKDKISNLLELENVYPLKMNGLNYKIKVPRHFIAIEKNEILKFKNSGSEDLSNYFQAIFVLESEKDKPLSEVSQFFAVLNLEEHEALNTYNLQKNTYQTIIKSVFKTETPLLNYLTEDENFLPSEAQNNNELTLATISGEVNNNFVLVYYKNPSLIIENMYEQLFTWQFENNIINSETLQVKIKNKYNMEEDSFENKKNILNIFKIMQIVIVIALALAIAYKISKKRKEKRKNK